MWKGLLIVACALLLAGSITSAAGQESESPGAALRKRITEDTRPYAMPEDMQFGPKSQLKRASESPLDYEIRLLNARIELQCRLWFSLHDADPWSKDKAIMTIELAKCLPADDPARKELYAEVVAKERTDTEECAEAHSGLLQYFLQQGDSASAKTQYNYLNRRHRLSKELASKLRLLIEEVAKSKAKSAKNSAASVGAKRLHNN